MGLILDSSVVIAAERRGDTVEHLIEKIVTKTSDQESALTAVGGTAHDAWFRARVQEALNDPRPAIPHKDVEAHFSKRRAAAPRKPL